MNIDRYVIIQLNIKKSIQSLFFNIFLFVQFIHLIMFIGDIHMIIFVIRFYFKSFYVQFLKRWYDSVAGIHNLFLYLRMF